MKRKLSVGDKMAGRHGNKGVIARILRTKICLIFPMGRRSRSCSIPFGVPSRMKRGGRNSGGPSRAPPIQMGLHFATVSSGRHAEWD